MKRYLFLQLKRQVKILPLVLAVTFVLLMSVSMILTYIVDSFNNDSEQKLFKVAITGDTDGDYIDLGLTALKTLDNTRFTMELLELTEEEAREGLVDGSISAYVVLPDNFIENALKGKVEKIRFVTSAGGDGIAIMLKNEFTSLITDMVVYSQKGTYGLNEAFKDVGAENTKRWDYVDVISIEYVDLVLHRSDAIGVESLGISDGLSTVEYYLCGMTVLLLMLISIPFASASVKKDTSLEGLLVSRGYSVKHQIMAELVAHYFTMLLSAAFILVCVRFMPSVTSLIGDEEAIAEIMLPFLIRIFISTLLISSMNMFIFELTDNIVSGVLIHFFTTLALGYISGYFYPIYALPSVFRKTSPFLPTGVLRSFMSGIFTEEGLLSSLLGVFIYVAVFIAGTVIVRNCKLRSNRG